MRRSVNKRAMVRRQKLILFVMLKIADWLLIWLYGGPRYNGVFQTVSEVNHNDFHYPYGSVIKTAHEGIPKIDT